MKITNAAEAAVGLRRFADWVEGHPHIVTAHFIIQATSYHCDKDAFRTALADMGNGVILDQGSGALTATLDFGGGIVHQTQIGLSYVGTKQAVTKEVTEEEWVVPTLDELLGRSTDTG